MFLKRDLIKTNENHMMLFVKTKQNQLETFHSKEFYSLSGSFTDLSQTNPSITTSIDEILFYIVHAVLLSNIQYSKDANVKISNEVEKIIKYIYIWKLLLQNNFTGSTMEGRRWNGLASLFCFLGKNLLYFLMLNLHGFVTLFYAHSSLWFNMFYNVL